MAKKQKHKKTASKNIIVFIFAILAVAAITCGVIVLIHQIRLDNGEKSDNAQDKNTANEILKTEDDLKDEEKVAESSNDAKDRMEADERVQQPVDKDLSGKNIAKPAINFISEEDGKIAIGGEIPNINETSGTCTYVFAKDGVEITSSTEILPNPSYISCKTARIDKSKFSAGKWQVKLKYKSETSEGESETQTFEIK